MKRVLQLAVFPLLTCIAVSCYYDNEEKLYPEIDRNNCDTLNITLSAGVQPVLASRCYSCHGNNTAASFGGGINLETYSGLKATADNGKLEGAIKHLSGYSPMPQGASKMDDCSINKIVAWINKGAPND
jgi:mono/diheme cytochrome c family protein